MTNDDAIKWLESLKQDIDQLRYDVRCHYEQAIDEICGLLKEQQPHLLAPDEADVPEVVWFEARGHQYIELMLTHGKRLADESEDWFQYGRDWRCWSARPTESQRKAVKWDD